MTDTEKEMTGVESVRVSEQCFNYPAVNIPGNSALEEKINRYIREVAGDTLPSGRYLKMNIIAAASKYDLTVNRNRVISFRFENYFYPEYLAHGITAVRGLTVNLFTGRRYRLKDLFLPDSSYQEYLNRIICRQIEINQIPLLTAFPGIQGNEVFYLTDDSLVIVYQRYELTPGAYGVLEFKIPYWELTPIIYPDSPVYWLL